MDWKEIGKKIITVAPTLGGALLGPAGLAGGTAISLIGQAFGLSEDELTPDKVKKLLSGDPESMLKLQQAELTFQVQMKEKENEELKMLLADVQSARSRNLEHERITGKPDYNLYVLAWIVVSGFFILVGMLMFRDLPTSNVGPINQLFGAMAAGFGVVLHFFFGTNKASEFKTALLAKEVTARVGY